MLRAPNSLRRVAEGKAGGGEALDPVVVAIGHHRVGPDGHGERVVELTAAGARGAPTPDQVTRIGVLNDAVMAGIGDVHITVAGHRHPGGRGRASRSRSNLQSGRAFSSSVSPWLWVRTSMSSVSRAPERIAAPASQPNGESGPPAPSGLTVRRGRGWPDDPFTGSPSCVRTAGGACALSCQHAGRWRRRPDRESPARSHPGSSRRAGPGRYLVPRRRGGWTPSPPARRG